MQYFNFLKSGDEISVIAPSMGCGSEGDRKTRCTSAINKFSKKGFKINVDELCYKDNEFARSAPASVRAESFENAFLDDNKKAIIPVTGGEFELEILPYINFNKIKKAPNKIFQGMSDNTCLSFLLPTLCDKASIYGCNFGSFGIKNWHKSLTQNFNFLLGQSEEQQSFKKIEPKERVENYYLRTSYNLTENSCPQILSGEKDVKFSGRIIGGCLDVLSHICGTKFDNVKNFVKKYSGDGIIWFFESCDLSVLEQSRCIWKLKNAGWFEGAVGFLIGRPLHTESALGCDYKMCNYENLKSFNVPIVIDLDIGHTNPTWYIVNGAVAHFEANNKGAKINFELS